ncbi:MAG: DUF3858 domain-containing protein, partial [Bacteroidia bacterium]|nr:DUF3858 domain-containing protein [Bacteroidia bacterium]
NTKRQFPLTLKSTARGQYNYVITISEEFSVVTPETNISLKNNVGSVQIKICKTERGTVYKREINIDKNIILPDEYDDFRNLMLIWYDNKYRQVIIKEVVGSRRCRDTVHRVCTGS